MEAHGGCKGSRPSGFGRSVLVPTAATFLFRISMTLATTALRSVGVTGSATALVVVVMLLAAAAIFGLFIAVRASAATVLMAAHGRGQCQKHLFDGLGHGEFARTGEDVDSQVSQLVGVVGIDGSHHHGLHVMVQEPFDRIRHRGERVRTFVHRISARELQEMQRYRLRKLVDSAHGTFVQGDGDPHSAHPFTASHSQAESAQADSSTSSATTPDGSSCRPSPRRPRETLSAKISMRLITLGG